MRCPMNARNCRKIDRLADRRRAVGGQPARDDGGNLRAPGAAGLPLWRVGVFVRTLHPDIFGLNFIWRPGAEVVVGTADFDLLDLPEFQHSPLAIVFGRAHEVRYRLDDPESRRFPFLDDMRAEGVTDYIALPLSSPTARFMPRAGPRSSRADSPTSSWRRCER